MELIKPGTTIPFTKYRRLAVVISSFVNLAVLLFLFIHGPDLGVDFAGGTLVHLKFQQRVTIPEIRQALEKANLGGAGIQDFGERDANEYLVRLEKPAVEIGALREQVKKSLTEQFGTGKFEVRRIEYVGPKVGQDLRFRATMSVIAATIMMGVYI